MTEKKPGEPDLRKRIEENCEPIPVTGCWLWTGCLNQKTGYGLISWHSTNLRAHRAAYMVFVGPLGAKSVLHKCDEPSCVCPNHLYLGTQADNVRDRVMRGRNGKQAMAKLTPVQVHEIRARLAAGEYKKRLAPQYGVHKKVIQNISNGKAYAWLK